MRLTTYTDYSLRVLIHLALRPTQLTTISAIARAYGISKHHLMKVAHQLGVAGYIDTVRGHGGGLRLARNPEEINIGQVVRRTEPDFHVVDCFTGPKTCVIESACLLRGVLGEAVAAFLDVLDRYTLADLVANPRQLSGLLGVVSDNHGKPGRAGIRTART